MESTAGLCPMSERRLPQEMYIKLFVVHFTVIVAYGHLMHMRREPRDLFSYLLMIGCPIRAALSLLSPVVALSVQAVVGVFHDDWASLMKQSIGILIGEVPEDEDNEVFETSYDWPPKKISFGAMGRVALSLALLVQCITSIWLFARRVEHGSDALYDHRILQLAILGLSVSIMSIIHVILNPRYPSRSTAREDSLALRWLTCWRPLVVFDDRDSAPNNLSAEAPRAQNVSQYPLLGVDWIYTCISLLISWPTGLEGDNILPITFGEVWKMELDFIKGMRYLMIILVPIVIQFRAQLSTQFRESPKDMIGCGLIVLAGVVASLLCLGVTVPLNDFVVAPILSSHQLWTLLSRPDGWQDYAKGIFPYTSGRQPDWRSIWTYGHIPSTIPCPKAWKDPVADRFWGLA